MTKPPRRNDGMCPKCGIRPKKRSYCVTCENKRQRDKTAGLLPKYVPPPKDANGLTELQAHIANYLCHGLTCRQITPRVGYSPSYVRRAKARIYDITGCINSAHLAAWAVLNGYYKPAASQKSDHPVRSSTNPTLLVSVGNGAAA